MSNAIGGGISGGAGRGGRGGGGIEKIPRNSEKISTN